MPLDDGIPQSNTAPSEGEFKRDANQPLQPSKFQNTQPGANRQKSVAERLQQILKARQLEAVQRQADLTQTGQPRPVKAQSSTLRLRDQIDAVERTENEPQNSPSINQESSTQNSSNSEPSASRSGQSAREKNQSVTTNAQNENDDERAFNSENKPEITQRAGNEATRLDSKIDQSIQSNPRAQNTSSDIQKKSNQNQSERNIAASRSDSEQNKTPQSSNNTTASAQQFPGFKGNRFSDALKTGKNILAEGKNLTSGANDERLRQFAKDKATQKIQNYAVDKLGNKIGNEAFKQGLQRGSKQILEKGASKALGQAGKKAAGTAAKKVAGKAAGQVAAKGATSALQGAISSAGVASAPETLGLGLIVAFLLNIAISLGVSDAIDCLIALKHGKLQDARFHAFRAVYRILMFVMLLIVGMLLFSVVGIIVGVPLLIMLNIYAVISIPLQHSKGIIGGVFGGLKWWGYAIVVFYNIWVMMITMVIAIAIFVTLCQQVSGVTGWLGAKFIDWTSGTSYTTQFRDVCQSIGFQSPTDGLVNTITGNTSSAASPASGAAAITPTTPANPPAPPAQAAPSPTNGLRGGP